MKKCDDVFQTSKNFRVLQIKKILIFNCDFHGEITSEKNAIGHFLTVMPLW